MSQIDKIIYLPLIFWFIFLFILFYFILLSLFLLIILVTFKTRNLYLKKLFFFSRTMLINTEYYIKKLNSLNLINFNIWNKLAK